MGPRGFRGPPGAAGAPGEVGPPGPPGPSTTLLGLSAQARTAGTVEADTVVPFDTLVNSSGTDIVFSSGSPGQFTIMKPGNYLVVWSVNVLSATAVHIQLGLKLGSATQAAVDAFIATGQIQGCAFVSVTAPGTVMTLSNVGTDIITLDSTNTTILANIVIAEVG